MVRVSVKQALLWFNSFNFSEFIMLASAAAVTLHQKPLYLTEMSKAEQFLYCGVFSLSLVDICVLLLDFEVMIWL